MQKTKWHVTRQQKRLRGDVVAIVIDETCPLHTIQSHQINPFTHAIESSIGVGVGIGEVGENRRLLCKYTARHQHHDKNEENMFDFVIQLQYR